MDDKISDESLVLGDELFVTGDYDFPAEWLHGREGVQGVVNDWIENPQGSSPLCLVKLHEDLPYISKSSPEKSPAGKYLLLKLRFREDTWLTHGVVNVFVFDRKPADVDTIVFDDSWVASHAEYQRDVVATNSNHSREAG